MGTKHEGNVLYLKYWNFWVRDGINDDLRSNIFFGDYEGQNADTDILLKDIGFPWTKAETEDEVWNRRGMVWKWLKNNVQLDNTKYSTADYKSVGYSLVHLARMLWPPAAAISRARLA